MIPFVSFQKFLSWFNVFVIFFKKNYKQFLLCSIGNLASFVCILDQLSFFLSVVYFLLLNVASFSKCLYLVLFFFLPLIHLLTQLQLFPLRKWFSNMCLRHTFRLSYLTVLPSFKTKKKKNWSNTKFLICPSSHSCSTQDYLYLTCVCVCSRIFFSVYSGLKF